MGRELLRVWNGSASARQKFRSNLIDQRNGLVHDLSWRREAGLFAGRFPFAHVVQRRSIMSASTEITVHRGTRLSSSIGTQITWFVAGLAFTFLIPFLFSSILSLQHDLYLLIYFVALSLFLASYVVETHADVVEIWRHEGKLSLVIGVLAAAFVVMSVLNREAPTAHPTGFYFGFEMVWRGLLYGVFDALILTAFPGMVAFALDSPRAAGSRGPYCLRGRRARSHVDYHRQLPHGVTHSTDRMA